MMHLPLGVDLVFGNFLIDESIHALGRLGESFRVLWRVLIQAVDVAPAWHLVAHVDADRTGRGCREDKLGVGNP